MASAVQPLCLESAVGEEFAAGLEVDAPCKFHTPLPLSEFEALRHRPGARYARPGDDAFISLFLLDLNQQSGAIRVPCQSDSPILTLVRVAKKDNA